MGEQYCGSYKRVKEACTNHRILVSDINRILASELRFVTDMAENNLDELVRLIHKSSEKSARINSDSYLKEKDDCEKRISQIDRMIKNLFEQTVINGLSAERFSSLTAEYEDEQKALKERVKELNLKLAEWNEDNKNIDRFIAVVKTYANWESLTPEIIVSFINKIVVHQMYIDDDGEKCQQVDIFFNHIGEFDHSNF